MRNRYLLLLLLIMGSFQLWARPHFDRPTPSPETENYFRNYTRADSLHGFDVEKYEIFLTINDQTHYLDGYVISTVNAEEDMNSITWDLCGLTVTAVEVNGISQTNFTQNTSQIIIPLTGITNGTQFTTTVYYSGVPSMSPPPYGCGMFFQGGSVFTISDPDASRYWWPCYDHPWDKALVDLHITIRDDWAVACNGLRDSIVDNGNGTKTHHWLGSNPMTTYLACVTAGNYTELPLQYYNGIPIQDFVLPTQVNNAQEDLSVLPEMMSAFSQMFGEYPFEKYGQTTVSMGVYGAMEHQTMTTLNSYMITGNHNYDYTFAHELCHQWFGNCLSVLTFKDIWLSEGFATYSEALWAEHSLGYDAMCNYFRSNIRNYYLTYANNYGPHTTYDPPFNAIFTPVTYEKPASVLHMLRAKVGNEAFFNILQSWFQQHYNGNVITSEFEQLCEDISGQELTQFFSQWIYGSGIPEVEFSVFQNYNLAIPRYKVFAKTGSNTSTDFTIDIPFHFNDNINSDSTLVTAGPMITESVVILNFLPSEYQLDPDDWMLIRGKEEHQLTLTDVYAGNNSARVVWESYWNEVPVVGYYVYRAVFDGPFQLMTPQPVTGTEWLDTEITPGTEYTYYITAVDVDQYESMPSNAVTVWSIAMPMNQGMLVVDETRDMGGGALMPTDEDVDQFYRNVLSGMNYTEYDYTAQGAPSAELLGNYSIVLWHDNDYSEVLIDDNLNALGSYLLGGGNLIVSGWKTAGQMNQEFLQQYFSDFNPVYTNNADFHNAYSSSYPTLNIDVTKIPANWNNALRMTYVFPNSSEDIIYLADYTDGMAVDNQPIAIKSEFGGSFTLMGLPLFMFEEEGVQSFLNDYIATIDNSVGNSNEEHIPMDNALQAFPNPFFHDLNIKVTCKNEQQIELAVYNIKGQKVHSDFLTSKNSMVNLNWDGKDTTGKSCAAGIYFLRAKGNSLNLTKRVLLLK
ncbi:MAG: T9SS type A sorting domain-containing protein [Candidatus Cloacimonetes bacterium]|nr:T9SS type A sorting domain-containing protein [Candidatus Cloacimonadota bacterium]